MIDNQRIKLIMSNELFINRLKEIKEAEKDRQFCGHDMEHFIDVARIAYILNLEKGGEIDKDIIYATALLHDIGRGYENHNEKSADLAEVILKEASFSQIEIDLIKDAILHHRHNDTSDKNPLAEIISKADRLSRKCYECACINECYWDDVDKNKYLKY